MAQPGDRVFNPQPWGSWFEFALPDLPVAIDSRIELFPASVWDAYEGVIAGVDGWQEQLDAWDVAFVVVGGRRRGASATGSAAGWRRLRRRRRLAPGRSRSGDATRYRVTADRSGTFGGGDRLHRAGRVGHMTERTADLDVVVLGGGGHVGLPLSLASPTPACGSASTTRTRRPSTASPRGEMPFMETGADELLRELLPTGRLELGTDPAT